MYYGLVYFKSIRSGWLILLFKFSIFIYLFILSFQGLTCSMWREVPRLGVKSEPMPQPRRIWAASATYTTAHSNARSLTHSARPGIELPSLWIKFVKAEPQQELPSIDCWLHSIIVHGFMLWGKHRLEADTTHPFIEMSRYLDQIPQKVLTEPVRRKTTHCMQGNGFSEVPPDLAVASTFCKPCQKWGPHLCWSVTPREGPSRGGGGSRGTWGQPRLWISSE